MRCKTFHINTLVHGELFKKIHPENQDLFWFTVFFNQFGPQIWILMNLTRNSWKWFKNSSRESTICKHPCMTSSFSTPWKEVGIVAIWMGKLYCGLLDSRRVLCLNISLFYLTTGCRWKMRKSLNKGEKHHPCKRGENKTCEHNHHGTKSINSEPGTPTTRCVAWRNCPTLGEGKLENKGPIGFRWVIDNTLTSHIKLYHMVMLLSCPECTIWTSKCPIFPNIHFQYLILKDTPLKFNISPLKIGQTCSKRSHSYHSSSDHH